jgi:hypothetical protein
MKELFQNKRLFSSTTLFVMTTNTTLLPIATTT